MDPINILFYVILLVVAIAMALYLDSRMKR